MRIFASSTTVDAFNSIVFSRQKVSEIRMAWVEGQRFCYVKILKVVRDGFVGAKQRLYAYVLIETYPAGLYIYKSVGVVHQTVRKFSVSVDAAIAWKLNLTE